MKSLSGGTLRPGESRAKDGVTSFKEPPPKPVDSHKAEDKIGGERQNKGETFSEIVWTYFNVGCELCVPDIQCEFKESAVSLSQVN